MGTQPRVCTRVPDRWKTQNVNLHVCRKLLAQTFGHLRFLDVLRRASVLNSFILLVRHLQRGVIAELLSLGTALEFFAHKAGQQRGRAEDRVNSREIWNEVFCRLSVLTLQ